MTKEVVIGTNDLVGATVTRIDGYMPTEITLEKDGRTLRIELEYEYWYDTCMCEGSCHCDHGSQTAYFVARELV